MDEIAKSVAAQLTKNEVGESCRGQRFLTENCAASNISGASTSIGQARPTAQAAMRQMLGREITRLSPTAGNHGPKIHLKNSLM